MNVFRLLQELAGEYEYADRFVKGSAVRQDVARNLLSVERENWLSMIDTENDNVRYQWSSA